MREDLTNEAVYDQDRLERHVFALRNDHKLSRREILQALGLAAGAATFGAACGTLPDKNQRIVESRGNLSTIFKPLPPDQFRIIGTSNAEMLWQVMKGKGYTTPNANFFVRNHTTSVNIDPTTWRLNVAGSGVRNPLSLSLSDLQSMNQMSLTRFVECAGNGRSFFASQQGTPTPGGQWRLGAIGVASWTGVRLADVLQRACVLGTAVDVMPAGLDPNVGTLGHVRRPMSIQKALKDAMVVLQMNGVPLPADHGFPARVLVPGWVGIANTKWVGSINVSTTPLFSNWNTNEYRLFGPSYPTPVTLTTQVVKSAFELPWNATIARGPRVLTGRSWTGAVAGSIAHVEVSFDGGNTWNSASMGSADDGIRDGGSGDDDANDDTPGPTDTSNDFGNGNDPSCDNQFNFQNENENDQGGNDDNAWSQWSINWNPGPGSYTLVARATDTLGNTQSATVPFNTKGYLFGALVNHHVTVT